METINVIYLYTNKVNGHQYVGQTVNLNERHKRHCKNYDKNSLIDKAIEKYGESNFELTILESVPHLKGQFLKNYLNKLEQFYISIYNPTYNQTKGGDDNPMNNPKIRKYHKKIMNSSKVKDRIPKFNSKNNPMKNPEIVDKYFRGDKNPAKRMQVKCKISKKNGSTGIYHLTKKHNKRCVQGFTWYYLTEDGRSISSTKLPKLLDKLKSENIELIIVDEQKANLIFEEGGVSL